MKGNPPHVLRPVSFDSIVIDEAAQASEPDIVLPATSASCRVIVVGDHKQLGLVEDISGYFRMVRFDLILQESLGCSSLDAVSKRIPYRYHVLTTLKSGSKFSLG